MNEIDIASIIIRIEQINNQEPPTHWLWDRVMTCDIPRLRRQLSPETLRQMVRVVDLDA
jgi:hypothetical protein